ncbi:hypothetical protein ACM792_28950 [Metapseudomonas otitidis]|uniref:hypothetical protein n=1 Tax=Metapseudomonas otitidis TaxID=319939 RepID=UPI0039FD1E63
MGIYFRFATTILIVLLSLSAHSAVRQTFNPSPQAVIKGTARTGAVSTPNGEIAFYGQEQVFEMTAGNRFNSGDSVGPTVRREPLTSGKVVTPYGEGAYYGTPNPQATKVKVQPVAKVPKSRITTKFKRFLKVSPAEIAVNAAMMTAVAAVGWVMSDDNTKIQKKVSEGNPIPPEVYGWKMIDGGGSCNNTKFTSPSASSSCLVSYYQSYLGSGYKIEPGSSKKLSDTSYMVFVTATLLSNGKVLTDSYGGRLIQQGACPAPAYIAGNQCLTGGPSFGDLSDSDYDLIDPWINKQGAAWLSDLLKEICEGSPNPSSCYSEMKSGGSLSGPSVVQGPSSVSTQSYLKPDGTQGTRVTSTKTEFGISYGDNYFDVTPKTTTEKTEDGTPVSTEVETDNTPLPEVPPDPAKPDESPEPQYSFQDTDFPEVEPFYKQQYPDGLKGVWNSKQKEFKDSAFLKFLSGFVPTFSGVCPSFGLDFNIATWAAFGHLDFMSLCWVFDFIKIIMMITTVFTCRALIFGG